MKRKLLALALLALSWPAYQVAKGADVSVDFFYNNLSGGSWIEVGDYGYCWQPEVAVSNTSWRPYADGYWAYTDLGWTWVSYEDFGWATYHYGRWARLADYGWVWVPGRDADLEWGPAWVSWRTGDQYVGWAPLPPETIGVVERGPITGAIDVEFDIGPAYYNFVDVRYIGEPVLRERIVEPSQNVTYIQQTTNVTNITYKNKTVYNYGPDINTINTRASRPIQRLQLERQQNIDVATAAKSGALTKVQGDKLVVAAPMRVTKPLRQVAPPAVKTRVAQPKLDRGWSVVGDQNAQRQFKEELRVQRRGAQTGAGAATQATTGASPAAGPNTAASPATAAAAASAAPLERGRGRHGNRAGANAAASPTGSPRAEASASAEMSPAEGTGAAAERGRHRGRRGEQFQGTGAAASPSGAMSPAETARGHEGGRHRNGEMPAGTEQSAPRQGGVGAADPESNAAQGGGGRHRGRQLEQGNAPAGAGEANAATEGERGRHRARGQEESGQPAGANARGAGASQDSEGEGGRHRGQGPGQAGGATRGGAEAQQTQSQDQEQGRGGKKRQVEGAPSASPSPH